MQFKLIQVKVIIVFCVLATGFLFASSMKDKNEIKVEALPVSSVSPEISPSRQIDEQKKNANLQMIQQDKYEEDLLRLRNFRSSGTLDDLIAEGKRIEKDWGKSGESYGKLILEFLGILSSNRYSSDDDKALNLSQNYVIQALRKADSFDFEMEWQLLIKLRYSISESKLSDVQIQERREKVKLWLHLIHRMETEKDKNFDPNDLPLLNVTPPEGVPVRFSGMSPNLIKDPQLRAEYEKAIEANAKKIKYYNKQYKLRQNQDFIVRDAVKYISKVYSNSPINSEEIESLLNKYKITEDIKNTIKEQIKLELEDKKS